MKINSKISIQVKYDVADQIRDDKHKLYACILFCK